MHEPIRVLKRRIITTLLVLGLVVGAGASAIASLIDTIDVRHQHMAYQAAERVAAAELLASAQQERSSNARGYLLTGDPSFLEKRRSARQEFALQLERLEQLAGDQAELRNVRALVTRLSESSDRALALWPRDASAAIHLWGQEVRPIQERVSSDLYAYVSSARASFAAARSAAAQAAAESRRLSLGLGAVMLGVLIGLFLQFARTARELLQRVRGEQEQVTFRLLDQVPVGIFVLDSQGAPYYANRSAERLLGVTLPLDTPRKTLTRTYQVYEAGTDRFYPAERTPLARALAGETSEVSDMELRRQD